ncbi:MAG: alpha/beta fold hydrolase [Longimicrobiales bacterium]
MSAREAGTPTALERSDTRIGDLRIHAVHMGAGPPIVLLHGLSGSHFWWRYTAPVLARRFRVHIPELVGFGRSTRPAPATIADAVAAVLAWWNAREIGTADVIGHSMGGQIAIHIATETPALVRRLVLAAPAGIPRPLRATELARLVAELVPPRAWGRLGFLPTIALDAVRAGPGSLAAAARGLLRDDVRPLLPRIRQPTLLLWGEHDPLIPVEYAHEMARAIPDARVIVLEQSSHNPMADRPDVFARAVLEFLRDE